MPEVQLIGMMPSASRPRAWTATMPRATITSAAGGLGKRRHGVMRAARSPRPSMASLGMNASAVLGWPGSRGSRTRMTTSAIPLW